MHGQSTSSTTRPHYSIIRFHLKPSHDDKMTNQDKRVWPLEVEREGHNQDDNFNSWVHIWKLSISFAIYKTKMQILQYYFKFMYFITNTCIIFLTLRSITSIEILRNFRWYCHVLESLVEMDNCGWEIKIDDWTTIKTKMIIFFSFKDIIKHFKKFKYQIIWLIF